MMLRNEAECCVASLLNQIAVSQSLLIRVTLLHSASLSLMNTTKPEQVRIYLTDAGQAVLSRLVDGSPLSRAQIVSVLVDAALLAIGRNGDQMTIPLTLTVSDPKAAARLNETSYVTPARSRK